MAVGSVDVTGGESVYCINQTQLEAAFRLARDNPQSAPRIERLLTAIENDLSRNEQAALAFVLIDRLLNSAA
ncbi:MAG: hypothetical protein OXC12_21285 [Spirochaetaceae bacterium]|nr:hypothetical protein [Spirochaetaceae bacterium]